jgi:hypothetical protein
VNLKRKKAYLFARLIVDANVETYSKFPQGIEKKIFTKSKKSPPYHSILTSINPLG